MHGSRRTVDQRHVRGPLDIIGDVHACLDELTDLLSALGYAADRDDIWRSPSGRTPVFVGDLVDRGPHNARTLHLVMQMVAAGAALCVPGNHDLQLARHLAGENVPLVYGLEETARELAATSDRFQRDVLTFLEALPGHLVFDEGALVVAHTGLPQVKHLDEGEATRNEAAYGPDGNDMDPHDPDKRHPWVATYAGPPVVYGHTPVLDPTWRRDSIDIDTGCAFGWRLTALRWPERHLVSVSARRAYAKRSRPFLPHEIAAVEA